MSDHRSNFIAARTSGVVAVLAASVLLTVNAAPRLRAGALQAPLPTLKAEPPVAALSPFIDVHVHVERAIAGASIDAAIGARPSENSRTYLFLPSPFDKQSHESFDIELLQSASQKYSRTLSFIGGGGTLNPMLQEAVHAGATSPALEKRFVARAETIARLGAVGFGELTAEHRPSASTPAYQWAPPDHRLLLLLSDIAARHNLPITLHMEAVPEAMPIPTSWPVKPVPNPPQLRANIAAFERLLAHNPQTRIVWAHAGSDNTGFRTPDLLRRLLGAHSNLYMELKIDPLRPGLNSPLEGGASGRVKSDWQKLLHDFPDRFVIGSDQHYPMPENEPQRWQTAVRLFNQLPPDVRRAIGIDNVVRIYNLKSS